MLVQQKWAEPSEPQNASFLQAITRTNDKCNSWTCHVFRLSTWFTNKQSYFVPMTLKPVAIFISRSENLWWNFWWTAKSVTNNVRLQSWTFFARSIWIFTKTWSRMKFRKFHFWRYLYDWTMARYPIAHHLSSFETFLQRQSVTWWHLESEILFN